jgi:tetratricopeptide (TPR) repeat protein
MPRLLRILLFLILAISFQSTLTRAQDDEASRENSETSKPHVAPSAAKSVEIADFYLKRKKYNAALSRYQEAVQSDPFYPPAYLGLGKVYQRIGLKRKALESYEKYLDLLPSQKDAEDAKSVQQAITKLKHDLKTRQKARGSPSTSDGGAPPSYWMGAAGVSR